MQKNMHFPDLSPQELSKILSGQNNQTDCPSLLSDINITLKDIKSQQSFSRILSVLQKFFPALTFKKEVTMCLLDQLEALSGELTYLINKMKTDKEASEHL